MPIPEDRDFYPENPVPTNVFSAANQLYYRLGENPVEIGSQPQGLLDSAGLYYMKAGISYLINHGPDDHTRGLGNITWNALSSKFIDISITSDLANSLRSIDIPEEQIKNTLRQQTRTITFFSMNQPKDAGFQIVKDAGHVILEPKFIHLARTMPVDALSQLVALGSSVRDYVNHIPGRSDIMASKSRARASQAQFLKEAQRKDPHLPLSAQSKRLLEEFPNGLNSLPGRLRYAGTTAGMMTRGSTHYVLHPGKTFFPPSEN